MDIRFVQSKYFKLFLDKKTKNIPWGQNNTPNNCMTRLMKSTSQGMYTINVPNPSLYLVVEQGTLILKEYCAAMAEFTHRVLQHLFAFLNVFFFVKNTLARCYYKVYSKLLKTCVVLGVCLLLVCHFFFHGLLYRTWKSQKNVSYKIKHTIKNTQLKFMAFLKSN